METPDNVREQAVKILIELTDSIPIDIIVRTPQQIRERIKMGDFFIKRVLKKGISL